ncbi:MAG: hypothetical protein IPO72_18980 [Saprospiraceae bacterium]|nr:hypothetical protein [Candidatus Vicinibacter affinis]
MLSWSLWVGIKYVERSTRTVVPNSQIPSIFTNDNEIHKLTFDAGNAGFIHAPSIARATTSAVLREG